MSPRARHAAVIAASAVLLALYARGGPAWGLGFVALVPWLRSLDAALSWRGTVLSGLVMTVAFAAATLSWFGVAIGQYTGAGTAVGLVVLLLAAPLLQPQILAFALVRRAVRGRQGVLAGAVAGAAAWVAAEAVFGKLLGDTLAIGLHPSALMRQAADLGGVAGLTLLLLLANEGVAAALPWRAASWRPLAAAALVPVGLAAYGAVVLHLARPADPAGAPLRVGLVQANIVDYERLRREHGAAAVVRQVLDTHFAMSYDAVERQRANAVLWSETVYPTTFGRPKSEAGAELDREILATVEAAGVPFVFGTYDRDEAGEYNAAAFVAPGRGHLGSYRKTRPFPFTEHVPPWLDAPWLRRLLPWTGHWSPGSGARVFPLVLADGREVPVLPLICLDDTDPSLAIDGARLGAQAILTMSNDAWFRHDPLGARLHEAAAAFRSIETRLPQFRVTANGHTALIDASGEPRAVAGVGERTLVVGEVVPRAPPRTLVVAWGDWVGRAAAWGLLAFAMWLGLRAAWRWHTRRFASADAASPPLPARVAVLTPAARVVAGGLRVLARASLLAMLLAAVFGDGSLQAHTMAQVRHFVLYVLVPEAAAWCVLLAYSAQASIESGRLVLLRGARRLDMPLADLVSIVPWRWPVPAGGVTVRAGATSHGLVHPDPVALARALGASPAPSRTWAYAHAVQAVRRGRLDRAVAKFVLFPLLLAIPAFRLHQRIAYGGTFGELQSEGVVAYLATFGLWWAAWAIGVVLCATALRAVIEVGTLGAVMVRPEGAGVARVWMERSGLALLYGGVPVWMGWRLMAG